MKNETIASATLAVTRAIGLANNAYVSGDVILSATRAVIPFEASAFAMNGIYAAVHEVNGFRLRAQVIGHAVVIVDVDALEGADADEQAERAAYLASVE